MIFLFFSFLAFAECQNFIAESEIPAAIALQPGAGAKKCGGEDACICFDGIDWEAAEYKNGKLKEVKAKKDELVARKATQKAARIAARTRKKELEQKIQTREITLEEIKEYLEKMSVEE